MGGDTKKIWASQTIEVADIDIDWDLIFSEDEKEALHATVERDIEWINAHHDGCFPGAGGNTTGEEVIFSPRPEDIDFARFQHYRVSDI